MTTCTETFKQIVCLALVLGACLYSGAPVEGRSLTAAGDEQGAWLLSPEPDREDTFVVLHHAFAGPEGQLTRVTALHGKVLPHSVAARDHTLWMIHQTGQVQAVSAKPYVLEGTWEYHNATEPSLPTGAAVRATAATHSGLWVLVRIEDAKVLQAIDQPQAETSGAIDPARAKRLRNIAIGLPPNFGLDQAQTPGADGPDPTSEKPEAAEPKPKGQPPAPPEEPAEAETPVSSEADAADPDATALPVDRLLHLSKGRWQTYPLPEDWPHGAHAWLVPVGQEADRPALIATDAWAGDQPLYVDVYEPRKEAAEAPSASWQHTPYVLTGAGAISAPAFLSVEGQLVAGLCYAQDGEVLAEFTVLRSGNVLEVGRLSLQGVSADQWSLLGAGRSAALIGRTQAALDARPGSPDFFAHTWTRADLRGQTLLETSPLAIRPLSLMDQLTQYLMLFFIALLIVMLMLAFWRRDSDWNKLTLPKDRAVADLGRRFIAAMIDLGPGLLAVMYFYELGFESLMLHWPGNGIAHKLSQVMPGIIVIATFVTHTTVSELIFSRTLGKALTGLRTTTLAGQRPSAWQLLVRGLLKILDLIPGAWLLLLLPVISPHKQRLGDLVARTVVTCEAPKTRDEPADPSDQTPTE